MYPIVLPAVDYIVPLMFYKDGLGIKWPAKVHLPLNKQMKPKFYKDNIYLFKII